MTTCLLRLADSFQFSWIYTWAAFCTVDCHFLRGMISLTISSFWDVSPGFVLCLGQAFGCLTGFWPRTLLTWTLSLGAHIGPLRFHLLPVCSDAHTAVSAGQTSLLGSRLLCSPDFSTSLLRYFLDSTCPKLNSR